MHGLADVGPKNNKQLSPQLFRPIPRFFCIFLHFYFANKFTLSKNLNIIRVNARLFTYFSLEPINISNNNFSSN
jgi:hypothetical protein